MLHIKNFIFNYIEENTYIIYDDLGETVIIDCGACSPEEMAEMQNFIQVNKLTPRRHLLTHAHFDHIFGAQMLYDKYNLKPELSAEDEYNYRNAELFMQMFIHRALPLQTPPYIANLSDGKEIEVGEIKLKVIFTPGHTAGGLCFFLSKEKLLFSGDTIFCNSTGRTDLPGGNYKELRHSIEENIFVLPQDTVILPGHGSRTTVGDEIRFYGA